ncbi:MAG: hypothetical protein JJE30_13235 [Desulfuromonadales bacterium]|nr:hypothetical protein [Desulfuromonadales bacterium]
MKKLLFALLLAFTLHIPALATSDIPDTTEPKIPVNFEISNTDGYREIYGPGEQIAIHVAGKSPELLTIDPKSGFHVQAMIVSEKQSNPYASVNGVFDDEKHAWLITFTVPNEASNSYHLVISLYCAQAQGPCVQTYGQAAQIQKILPLQVR